MLADTATALADAIRDAGGIIGEGDIFTADVAPFFRERIRTVMRGPAGRRVHEAVFAVQPTGWSPSVGALYPARQPVSSMPLELLAALPSLPRELEYRVVGRDLLLLDRNTGLIVDMLRGALSAPVHAP